MCAARSHAYDGLWSVSIRTQSGPCDPSYRYPARIVGGQVVQADNDFSYQISGDVVSSGAIAVTVSKGLGSATGYGRLHGAIGRRPLERRQRHQSVLRHLERVAPRGELDSPLPSGERRISLSRPSDLTARWRSTTGRRRRRADNCRPAR